MSHLPEAVVLVGAGGFVGRNIAASLAGKVPLLIGVSASGTGGSAGSGELGSDTCARAPVDACDLLSACESVKARRNCSDAIEFVVHVFHHSPGHLRIECAEEAQIDLQLHARTSLRTRLAALWPAAPMTLPAGWAPAEPA